METDVENAVVNFDYPDLLFLPNEPFNVTWNPENILLHTVFGEPSSFTVDVVLHEYNFNTEVWTELQVLANNIPNTGETQVMIQGIIDNRVTFELPDVCRIAIAVAVSRESTSLRKRTVDFAQFERIAGAVKQWTREAYAVVKEMARNALANTLRSKCKKWCDEQPPNIGQEILDRLPPCPPTVQQAHVDNRFQLDNRLIRFFHPGAENCFRQSTITRLVL